MSLPTDLLPLPRDPRWRRLFLLVCFVGLLVGFRHLAPVFICFVILQRLLGFVIEWLKRRLGELSHRALVALVVAVASALGGAGFAAARAVLPWVHQAREGWRHYATTLTHHPLFEKFKHMREASGEEDLVDTVKHHALDALHYVMEVAQYAMGVAHVVLSLIIGLVLAVIYLSEREHIDKWMSDLPSGSLSGTMSRWFGYVADSIVVTVRMQVVTAIVNGLITLPVLLVLRLPQVPMLFVLIVVSGLLPVVGNFVSGAVLCAVAYQTKGAWAVGVFLVVTFVLHQIEEYYLAPRLAAQHVAAPGIVLVVSLVLFEHALGFWGLFLSFPTLYVAQRILYEWKTDGDAQPATEPPAAPSPGPG